MVVCKHFRAYGHVVLEALVALARSVYENNFFFYFFFIFFLFFLGMFCIVRLGRALYLKSIVIMFVHHLAPHREEKNIKNIFVRVW